MESKYSLKNTILFRVLPIIIPFVVYMMINAVDTVDYKYYAIQNDFLKSTSTLAPWMPDLPIAHLIFYAFTLAFPQSFAFKLCMALTTAITILLLSYVTDEVNIVNKSLPSIMFAFHPYTILLLRYGMWKNVLSTALFIAFVLFSMRKNSLSYVMAGLILVTHSFGAGMLALYTLVNLYNTQKINKKYVIIGLSLLFILLSSIHITDWENPWWTYSQFKILTTLNFSSIRLYEALTYLPVAGSLLSFLVSSKTQLGKTFSTIGIILIALSTLTNQTGSSQRFLYGTVAPASITLSSQPEWFWKVIIGLTIMASIPMILLY